MPYYFPVPPRFHLRWPLVVFMLAATAASSMGGPSAPPVAPPVSVEADNDAGLRGGVGLAVTVGWDSHYIFRGEPIQLNTGWVELSYDLALTEALSLNVTPWFLQDFDSDFNEFDLTAALTYTLDPWAFSLGYAGYYYPRKSWGGNEGIGDEQEMSAAISRQFGDFSATLLGAYSFTRDAFYFEVAAEYSLTLSDALTLTPAVVLGWDADYYAAGTDLNHLGLRLSLDYQVTPWCTLTPYVAGNFPLGHLEADYGEDVFGGVSLTIVF